LGALLLCAGHASADEPSATDRARAATLRQTGADAAKAKRWDACIEALTAAVAIDDAPTTWGELGLCEEAAGRYALADLHLRRAMEGGPAERGDPWTRYNAAVLRVAERVALVFLTSYPHNARIVLDGRPLGMVNGRTIAVEPGEHTFVARLEGYEDESYTNTFRARDTPNVHLQLKPKPQAKPAPAASATSSAMPRVSAPVRKLEPPPPWYAPALSMRGVLVSLSYVGLATAAVSGGTAIALEVDRSSLKSGLTDDACYARKGYTLPAVCPALGERLRQHEDAMNAMIFALSATGVVGAATVVATILERRAPSPSIAPMATSQGGGIVIFGAW
jgi:hypothetical protein